MDKKLFERVKEMKEANPTWGRRKFVEATGASERRIIEILTLLKEGGAPLAIAGKTTLFPFGVEVGTNYLILPDSIDDAGIGMVVRSLRRIEGSLNWMIGDLLEGVKRLRGDEKAGIIAESFGISEQRLYAIRRVCELMAPSCRQEGAMRNPEASFEHHSVALLECSGNADGASKWIKRAVKEDWSVSILRQEIRKKLLGNGNDAPGPPLSNTGYGEIYKMARACKALKVGEWSESQKEDLKKTMKPIHELYEKL